MGAADDELIALAALLRRRGDKPPATLGLRPEMFVDKINQAIVARILAGETIDLSDGSWRGEVGNRVGEALSLYDSGGTDHAGVRDTIARVRGRNASPEPKELDEPAKKQADILIDLAKAAYLFHTPDRRGYADLRIDGH